MVDLEALEEEARGRLDPGVYDYLAGGAMDETTVAANRAAWGRVRFRPRVLRDVASVDTATTFLGSPVATPIAVAPTAFHRMTHADGEPATAAGAAAAGALYVLSTRSTSSVEDVAVALGDSPWWYQVYLTIDRELSASLVKRAVAAGARALVLTGDTPVLGRRLRDVRNRFTLPANLGTIESLDRPGNLSDQDASVTFADIGPLLDLASGNIPLLVKGVLRADDAIACVEAGAAGVIVSNHGGRQLDAAVATADALPEVVAAIGDRAEVYVDGGVRRGTDALAALAMGAKGVLLGRPVLWGLATGGSDGVRRVLEALTAELALSMQLAGARDLGEITPDLLA